MHFGQAALVAFRTAEVSVQKGLDEFTGQRRPDHLSTETIDFMSSSSTPWCAEKAS
jgi:hypothetical protein